MASLPNAPTVKLLKKQIKLLQQTPDSVAFVWDHVPGAQGYYITAVNQDGYVFSSSYLLEPNPSFQTQAKLDTDLKAIVDIDKLPSTDPIPSYLQPHPEIHTGKPICRIGGLGFGSWRAIEVTPVVLHPADPSKVTAAMITAEAALTAPTATTGGGGAAGGAGTESPATTATATATAASTTEPIVPIPSKYIKGPTSDRSESFCSLTADLAVQVVRVSLEKWIARSVSLSTQLDDALARLSKARTELEGAKKQVEGKVVTNEGSLAAQKEAEKKYYDLFEKWGKKEGELKTAQEELEATVKAAREKAAKEGREQGFTEGAASRNAEVAALQAKVAGLEGEVQYLKTEIDGMKSGGSAEVNALNVRIGKLEADLAASAGTVKTLEGEKKALEEEVTGLRASLQTANDRIADLQTRIAALEASVKEEREGREKAETSLTAANQEIGRINTQAAELRQQLDARIGEGNNSAELLRIAEEARTAAQARIEVLEGSVATLNTEKKALEDCERALTAQVGELTTARDAAVGSLNDANAQIASLNGQITELNTQVTNLNASLETRIGEGDNTAKQLHDAQRARDEAAAKVQDLEQQLTAATSTRDQHAARIATLETELAASAASIKALEDQKAALEGEKAELTTARDQAVGSLQTAAANLQTANEEIAQLKAAVDGGSALNATVERLQQELQAANDAKAKREEEVTRLQSECDALRALMGTIGKQHDTAAAAAAERLLATEQDRDAARARAAELEATVAALQQEKKALEDQLAQQREAKDADIAALTQQVADLRASADAGAAAGTQATADLTARLAAAEKALQKAEDDGKRLGGELQRVSGDMAGLVTARQSLAERVAVVEEEKRAQSIEIDAHREEQGRLQEEIRVLRIAGDAPRAELERTRTELQQVRAQLAASQEQAAATQQRLTDAEAANADLRKRLDQATVATDGVAALCAANADLEARLSATVGQLTACQDEVSQMRPKFEHACADNTRLLVEMDAMRKDFERQVENLRAIIEALNEHPAPTGPTGGAVGGGGSGSTVTPSLHESVSKLQWMVGGSVTTPAGGPTPAARIAAEVSHDRKHIAEHLHSMGLGIGLSIAMAKKHSDVSDAIEEALHMPIAEKNKLG